VYEIEGRDEVCRLQEAGDKPTFVFIQDGTGGRTVTWNAFFKQTWSDAGNTLGKRSTITFELGAGGNVANQIGAQSPYV